MIVLSHIKANPEISHVVLCDVQEAHTSDAQKQGVCTEGEKVQQKVGIPTLTEGFMLEHA